MLRDNLALGCTEYNELIVHPWRQSLILPVAAPDPHGAVGSGKWRHRAPRQTCAGMRPAISTVSLACCVRRTTARLRSK